MNYQATLKTGEEILLQNDGDQTRIQLQSGENGSRASQGSDFATGKWSQAPTLYAREDGAVLQVETDGGPIYFGLKKNAVERLEEAPDLDGAEKIKLQETDEAPASVHIEPMAPMKPMKPMEPLKPH